MAAAHKHDKSGLVCNHVLKRKRVLAIVAHDPDGIWQFMCGRSDHTSEKQAKRICVDCALTKFAGTLTREDVPRGHIAQRTSSKAEWTVREMNQEELDTINETGAESATG